MVLFILLAAFNGKTSTMTFADELSLSATLATCGTRAGFAEPGRKTMPIPTQSIPQTVNHHFSLLSSACTPQNVEKIFFQNKAVYEVHELSPQHFNQCKEVHPKLAAPSTHLLAVEVYLGASLLSGLKIHSYSGNKSPA